MNKKDKNTPLGKNIYGLRANRKCKGTEDRWGPRNRTTKQGANEKQTRMSKHGEEDGQVVEK